MTTTLEEMWKEAESLPIELQKIFWSHWDYTGRPKRAFAYLIIDLLNKNAERTYAEFEADYLAVRNLKELSLSDQETLQIYWGCFVAGANYLSKMLRKGK